MEPALEILYGYVQFDLQQIQNYREAIFNISVATVAFSFGVSAFVYAKDSRLTLPDKRVILALTNGVVFIFLVYITWYYENHGLYYTRAMLELREHALSAHLFRESPLTKVSLFPEVPEGFKTELGTTLEKIPLYLAIIFIGLKGVVESVIIRRATEGEPPAI